jgi:hypothetical protein
VVGVQQGQCEQQCACAAFRTLLWFFVAMLTALVKGFSLSSAGGCATYRNLCLKYTAAGWLCRMLPLMIVYRDDVGDG